MAGTASIANGIHFVGLVNVMNLKAAAVLARWGTGKQLEWLEKDVSGLKSSTPIVVICAHSPVGRVSAMGLGHRR